ncbi:glycosyltransferase [Ornithinimicrobium pratense]|uniref:Glycosyltransferase family 4 protein n=1 Tax=Ornithinimicrobium pratense TaxID=2593973 RepID=A0A5J6V3B6_9MICO|nr:glycosyltransferase [Ornithinimicrobium pratense]QFG68359.1 glycosyltransferase family 4 protein [Ornithinimicrobium pratense]
MSAQLTGPGGQAPRIALLVFRDADTDSRVLRSAATLQEAGAEVLVIGLAPTRSGLEPGPAVVGGVPLHRTMDLDLVRTFGTAARVWRRLRGRDPVTGATSSAAERPDSSGTAASGTAPSQAFADPPQAGSRLPLSWRKVYQRGFRTARLVRYWAGALVTARRFGADVVHANDGNTLAPALLLRVLQGTRIVYDSHELWLHRNVRPRLIAPLVEAVIERAGVRWADAVLTVSPSIVRWLQRHYRLAEPPLLVRNVPLWPGALPDPARGRLRELAGLSPRDKVISYCGGVTRGRGLEETIDALAMLPSDVHLVMLGFGSGDYVRGLLARAAAAGLTDRVHLVGPVPSAEVPQSLADADLAIVYVRPIVLSYTYSLPNKLFESIHAGLPIVAADLPDVAALVEEHGVGTVFAVPEGAVQEDGDQLEAADDPARLAAALAQVLADPEPYRRHTQALAPLLDWRHEAEHLIEGHARAVARCGT